MGTARQGKLQGLEFVAGSGILSDKWCNNIIIMTKPFGPILAWPIVIKQRQEHRGYTKSTNTPHQVGNCIQIYMLLWDYTVLVIPIRMEGWTSWSNLLMTGIYPAVSAQRHGLMPPPYRMISIHQCQVKDHSGVTPLPCREESEQGKSEGFDSCDRPSNLNRTGFKSLIFQPLWPWNLLDDLRNQ